MLLNVCKQIRVAFCEKQCVLDPENCDTASILQLFNRIFKCKSSSNHSLSLFLILLFYFFAKRDIEREIVVQIYFSLLDVLISIKRELFTNTDKEECFS